MQTSLAQQATEAAKDAAEDVVNKMTLSSIWERLQENGVWNLAWKILICVLVLFIANRLIRQGAKLIQDWLKRFGAEQGAITFITSLLRVVLYAIVVVNILIWFGMNPTSIAAVIASGGVAICLAVQDSLANLAGGVMILIFHPFRVGDYIITNNVEGTVDRIEIFYTVLRTIDNQKIVLPNGSLSNNTIVNATDMNERLARIKVTVSYETNLKLAKKILSGLLEENPCVIKEKPTTVLVDSLGETGVHLEMRGWIKTEDYWQTSWDLTEAVKEAFEHAGIRIACNRLMYEEIDTKMN